MSINNTGNASCPDRRSEGRDQGGDRTEKERG